MSERSRLTARSGPEGPALSTQWGDGVFGLDRDDRCTFINDVGAVLLGYSADALVGQLMHERVHHHRADGGIYPLEVCPSHVAIRDGRVQSGHDEVFWRGDTTPFPVEYVAHPVVVGGAVTGAVVVFRDTHIVAAADALSAELEQQASLLDLTHDAVFVRDLQGKISYWNRAAELTYGWTAAEAIGQISHDLLRARFSVPLDEIDAIMARAGQWDGRLWHHRRDGTEMTMAARWSLHCDSDGRPDFVLETNIDVSATDLADARFKALLDNAPDAIVGVNVTGRIELANSRVERVLGYRQDELIGQFVELLVPERALAAHPGLRAGYFAHPVARPMGAGAQLVARRKDGTEFPADIALSAIDTDQGLWMMAAIRDVSERERLRTEAEEARALARAQQAQRLESLGQLAGGVAHDFNNLLGAILNYTAFIAEEVAAAEAHDSARWEPVLLDIEQVERAANRAAELTRQLLAFGRREVVQARHLDLNEVVAEVETLLRRTLGEHIQLVIRPSPAPAPIYADPGQLDQVLVNLAVNARDAMPGGGTLAVDIVHQDIDEAYVRNNPSVSPGSYVRLRVSDTGAGMAPDVIARAFEPFFTTKAKGEGTGLGLATVHGIVSQAGGHVRIYSEPGVGTTVSVLFPEVGPESAGPAEAEARSHRQPGSETVLVVEDEDALREVTRRLLARNGHTVLTAASGAAALQLAAEHRGVIDLLLTDVVMPRMLGKELAERIRAARPEVRVLFMSGYAQPVLASQGTLAEGVELVDKPFTEAELLAKVRAVLDQGH